MRTAAPFSIKLILVFLIVCLTLFVFGQGGALVSYDAVAEMGLQDLRQSVDPVIVEVNKGIALADVLVAVPLFVAGIIGLWRVRMYGVVASWMVLGINIYWPLVAWSKSYYYLQAGVKSQPLAMSIHVILGFVVIFSVWAAGYLFRNRNMFK